MKKLKADITLLVDGNGARLEINDRTSRCSILRAEIPTDVFMKALGRLSHQKIEIEVGPAEKWGLKHQWTYLEFPLPEEAQGLHDRKKLTEYAQKEAEARCPAGWEPDRYYGAQDSFFRVDGVRHARCTIRRWVPAEEGAGDD